MNQDQRELRRAASEAFLASLNKLEETLHVAPNEPVSAAPAPAPVSAPAPAEPKTSQPDAIDLELAEFEQALADIEQFIQTQSTNASTTPDGSPDASSC